MPKIEYNSERHDAWVEEFRKLVNEYMTTEGNDRSRLENEFENALASVDAPDLEPADEDRPELKS